MAEPAPTLRVLYSFPHSLGGSGIGNTAWQQVNALHDAGVQVTVYCTSLRDPLPTSVRVVQTLRVAGRRIPHRALGVQRAYDYHDLRTSLAVSPDRYDLVHAWPRACLRTFRRARLGRVPSFRELPNAHTASTFDASAQASRDAGVPLPPGFSHRPDATRLAREEREFEAADFLLAPSQFVLDSFLERGTSPGRLVRHAYGYDPTRFSAADRDDSGTRAFTAVFVGRGEPAKGVHYALQAWLASAAAEHGRFLILGRFLDEYRETLRDQLAHPSVEVLGFVDDVGAVLRQADVLLFPTYTEGSALVTFESMASGLVPLVSRAAGAPVTDGVDGFLHDVGDVAALVEQLDLLAGDPQRLAQLRSATLATSAGQSWRATGPALVAAYRAGLATVAQLG
jgi:glycosyltransferase involved in cell wall biosynthesis